VMSSPRVSIIVTSFNYGRFLAAAIESCLAQTYPDTEVIVVDDGSTDDSRRIIEGYGSAVQAIFKENGGHASAINVGFAACSGDIVCPLDSDDIFAPHKVERTVSAWKAQPGAFLAYHQLQTIDASGRRSGSPWPARTWNGCISQRIQNSGGWWPRPTTSGLCFSRPYLERVLPMPVGFRVWPDTYLAPPAAILAPVIGINEALGSYRYHGDNTITKVFPSGETAHDRQEIADRRVTQMEMEGRLLKACLDQLMATPPPLRTEGNPELLSARRTAGQPVSVWDVLRRWAMCPAIPVGMRPRVVAKAIDQLLAG
jgi:glycosyltransferase involved in cell wall biosynthesis